jgi:hypothetical protein
VDTAGCILQGDVGTKVKTPGAGKNERVGETVQAPTMERLCKLLPWRDFASSIISQSRVHTWSPTMYHLYPCFETEICFKVLSHTDS